MTQLPSTDRSAHFPFVPGSVVCRRYFGCVPDWLTVDLVQTLTLRIATLLAFLAFVGEHDARRDAAIERRLERVSTAVTRLARLLDTLAPPRSAPAPAESPAISRPRRPCRERRYGDRDPT